MAVGKKFYEAVSKDETLRAEVERATAEALSELLKEKGLEEEAAKATAAATEKVAAAYGLASEEGEKLNLDELDTVSGGVCACIGVGGGDGCGKQCACVVGGAGDNDTHKMSDQCVCVFWGTGEDRC